MHPSRHRLGGESTHKIVRRKLFWDVPDQGHADKHADKHTDQPLA